MLPLIGFPPIVGPAAKLLILGSMPGAASLRAAQYYAHPRNAFWPIMGRLFDAGPDRDYDERSRILTSAGVAVWDVLQSCGRIGSLDSAITDERPNSFAAFFAEHGTITDIFFNGGKAEQVFLRKVLPTLAARPLALHRLPSTSPAHAGMSFERKLAAWKAVAACADAAGDRDRNLQGAP